MYVLYSKYDELKLLILAPGARKVYDINTKILMFLSYDFKLKRDFNELEEVCLLLFNAMKYFNRNYKEKSRLHHASGD